MIKGYASDQTITRQSSPTSFINNANSSWICILEGMWVGKCWERHCNIGTYKVFVNACKGHSLFRTCIERLTSSAIPRGFVLGAMALQEGDMAAVIGTTQGH